MSRYLAPRHLGGTKTHPLSLMDAEDRRAQDQIHAQNRQQRFAGYEERNTEKRARQYQLQDQQSEFQREVDLARLQQEFDLATQANRFNYESTLQGERFAGEADHAVLMSDLTRIRDEEISGRALHQMDVKRLWDIQDTLRDRGWEINDREWNADQAVSLMEKENEFKVEAAKRTQQLAIQSSLLSQEMEKSFADTLRSQDQIDRGQKRLTPALQQKLDVLRQERGEILTSDSLGGEERMSQLLANQMAQNQIYKSAETVPVNERAKKREELLQQMFGSGYEGVKDLPFYIDPETGAPTLPRGWKMPTEDEKTAAATTHPVYGYKPKELSDQYWSVREEYRQEAAKLRAMTNKDELSGKETPKYTEAQISQILDPIYGDDLRRLEPIGPPEPAMPITPTWNQEPALFPPPPTVGPPEYNPAPIMPSTGNLQSAAGFNPVPQIVASPGMNRAATPLPPAPIPPAAAPPNLPKFGIPNENQTDGGSKWREAASKIAFIDDEIIRLEAELAGTKGQYLGSRMGNPKEMEVLGKIREAKKRRDDAWKKVEESQDAEWAEWFMTNVDDLSSSENKRLWAKAKRLLGI